MPNIILRPNATPVYRFLSYILSRSFTPGKILDCGAGGLVPPLAIFAQQGFDCWGIDISDEQLAKAETYALEHNLTLHLQKADMRQMPFEDADFDFVYEQFAMCHMRKQDTAQSIREMRRVLKPGGLSFLGFISTDCDPKDSFGVEQAPGEFYGDEGGKMTLHSMFSDEEVETLLAGWEVLSKQKQITYDSTDGSQYVHLYFILQKA